MSSSRMIRRVLAAAALASGSVLIAAATPSSSNGARPPFHLALKRAEPGINDTVAASPKQLKLWFTETVAAPTTSVRLVNAQSEALKVGDVSVESAPLSPAIVTVPENLAAGTYTVMWRAMADDGHPSTGKFSFTVR